MAGVRTMRVHIQLSDTSESKVVQIRRVTGKLKLCGRQYKARLHTTITRDEQSPLCERVKSYIPAWQHYEDAQKENL